VTETRYNTWVGCTPDGKPPIIGHEYVIQHSRRGTFSGIAIEHLGHGMARFRITKGGTLRTRFVEAKGVGGIVVIRGDLCRMDLQS
jgi:hypothetical protein